MRPTPGVMDRLQRRGSLEAEDTLSSATPTVNMPYFITTEAALDACSDDSAIPQFHPSLPRRKRSLESSSRPPRSQLPSPAPTGDSITSVSSSAMCSDFEPEESQERSPMLASRHTAGISGPASAVSSRRHSMGASSPHHATPSSDTHSAQGHPPQLIMPSLAVPQRRPFSEAGKSVGQLKLLVAGSEGIGKTSLIHAIAHCCEHIVHIDPVSSTAHPEFSELWASTRPRPWWRGESDLTASRKRRRSSAGDILDRNVCFVVRSALQQSASPFAECEYVDAQLSSLLERPIGDADLSAILHGGGEPIVDAVLFLIRATGLEARDVEVIRSLQAKTNVIPLLARSDELDADAVKASKDLIRQQVDEQSLECFTFFDPGTDREPCEILAVSSATMADYDVMDASILMSSGYVQPLVPTDLERLVNNVFSADGSAWLRHAASEKCIRWRKDQAQGLHLDMALMHRDPAKCALSPVLTVNPFVQRRQWGRIEMSNWAQGLRDSLEVEKCGHVATQRALSEYHHRRTPSQDIARRHRGAPLSPGQKGGETRNLTHQDPLGLLHIGSTLKRNGRPLCELITSLGLFGCFAAWVVGLRSGAKATGHGRHWLDLLDLFEMI